MIVRYFNNFVCTLSVHMFNNISEGESIMTTTIKEKRIEFRVSEESKRIIEYAAELANISLSSYILSVVLKQAKLDIEQSNAIVLNNKERDSLIKSLKKPAKPNKELKELFNK